MGESTVTKKKDKKMINFLKKIDLKTLLIICLIIVILLMRMCEGSGENDGKKIVKIDGKKYEVIKHTIDTVIVPVKQTVYKEGKTIYKEVPIYVQYPPDVKIDTAQILKEFYSKVVYKDTLKLKDSLGYVTITDTITKNSILNRFYDANINKTTVKETLIVKDLPTNQVYIGGVAGFDRTNIINFLGPNFVLKTKKDKMFSLGFGYGLNKNISVQAGMYWKISLKKKK
jgi:hypothetical protein